MNYSKFLMVKKSIKKEIAIRLFRGFVISIFIAFIIGDILYFHVRLSDYGFIEPIKIEYFSAIFAVILGIGLALIPLPSTKNVELIKVIRSLSFTLAILFPYCFYLFLMEQLYGGQAHLYGRIATITIFGFLLFLSFYLFFFSSKDGKI